MVLCACGPLEIRGPEVVQISASDGGVAEYAHRDSAVDGGEDLYLIARLVHGMPYALTLRCDSKSPLQPSRVVFRVNDAGADEMLAGENISINSPMQRDTLPYVLEQPDGGEDIDLSWSATGDAGALLRSTRIEHGATRMRAVIAFWRDAGGPW